MQVVNHSSIIIAGASLLLSAGASAIAYILYRFFLHHK